MAHRRPIGSLTNRGDGAAVIAAGSEMIKMLTPDRRTVEAYTAWRRRRSDILARFFVNPNDPILDRAVIEAITEETPIDRRTVDQLVVTELRLPHRRWLGPALLKHFQIATYNDINPRDRRAYQLQLGGLATIAKGRWPARQGEHIIRGVRWYYRSEIKQPADDLPSLETEYATAAARGSEAHSTIDDGIKLAKNLLDLISVDDEKFEGWLK